MVVVLDATALMTYLKKEQGYEIVKEQFIKVSDSDNRLLMSTVNWGEIYYLLIKQKGIEQADEIQKAIETLPIEFIEPDLRITKQAAKYKAMKKLPYVDSFAAALAKVNDAELITKDNDFRLLGDEIKIIWIK